MWLFYVLTLLPLAVGAVLWFAKSEVVWWEWLASFLAALLISVIFHALAFNGMTGDVETWSGEVTHVIRYPRWVEKTRHEEDITNEKGEKTGTRVWYTYTTHPEHWKAYSNIDTEREIEKSTYLDLCYKFGNNIQKKWVHKNDFDSGDHHIYPCYNETGYCQPINDFMSFTNRVKAAPTLFSFPPVPQGAPVFEYPKNDNWFSSDRLLGSASQNIDLLEWDRLNARLGGAKKVNLIMVGFPSGTAQMTAEHQKSKWIGGKKNDLVICYAGGDRTKNPEWVTVFGWSEEEICKENLESLILYKPINNNLIPLIEKEVRANYKIKDWKKFDYITIEPPTWSYWVFFIVLIGTQIGYWIWACNNGEGKGSPLFCAFQRQYRRFSYR